MKENSTDKQQQKQRKARKKRFIVLSLYRKMRDLLSIHDDTDIAATIASIQKAVVFRGINIWILFFAIIIASIGLNVNSTAVIIGAMLISPLMGPILGLGLAVGTFDMNLLRKSFRNFAIMVGISLLASTIYFILSPLSDAQSELLARTRPTIFDVLIATFGGLAGIVAASRKEQPFTVISGVAIATALMPPLCTAGYGLATLQFGYFFGAFYLFFINTFFIALATFLIVRYLKFPVAKFINPKREKIVKRSIVFLALIVIIPSFFTAISVIKESAFSTQAIRFVNELKKNEVLPEAQLIGYEKVYDKHAPTLTLSFIGKELSQSQLDTLNTMLVHDYHLASTQLKIKQTSQIVEVGSQAEVLESMLYDRESVIQQQATEIEQLRDSIRQSSNRKYAEIAHTLGNKYQSVIAELAIADNLYYRVETETERIVPTLYIRWRGTQPDPQVLSDLRAWTPTLLGVDQVRIVAD